MMFSLSFVEGFKSASGIGPGGSISAGTPEKVQKTLEVGAAALKNQSLKLTKKFRDWKNGTWRRMKRSNIESKRTKKKGKPVLVNKGINSKECKRR